MVTLILILAGNLHLDSLVIAITGYVIVYAALVLLFWLFNLVPRLISFGSNASRPLAGRRKRGPSEEGISGEETAAIALALHLFMEDLHDEESGVLTIKRISKAYSPWSSKIYAVRNQFNRQ